MSNLDPNHEWMPRSAELKDNDHLLEQARRVYQILKVVRGIKDCPTYDVVVHELAQLVALVEVTGAKQTANVGGIIVTRGPMEGYGVMMHVADIYVMHLAGQRLDGWDQVHEYWAREPQETEGVS